MTLIALGHHSGRALWQLILTPINFFVMLALAIWLTGCSRETNMPLFADVTPGSGLDAYLGMTHGVAWGDFNGDGLADVYLTNHLQDAKLFQNLGSGRFTEVSAEFFSKRDLGGDKHGVAWADLDNDGRLDLVQLTGAVQGMGSEAKRLFLNRGTKFEEVAEQYRASNPFGRTRMPLWLDLDRDGHLDLIQGAETRFDDRTPPLVFLQRGNRFEEAAEALHFASRSVPFCIATELTNDGLPELLCRVAGKGVTAQVFDTANLPARELQLLPITAFEDAVAGDFDNDGLIDLFLARKNPPGAVAIGRPASNELIADVWINRANTATPEGFSFQAGGDVRYDVAAVHPPHALTPEAIHIGAQDRRPDGLQFSLSPDSPASHGMASTRPDTAGLYVGLTPPDRWQVQVSAGDEGSAPAGAGKYQQVALRIVASSAIAQLTAADGTIHAEEAPQRLFMNRGGKLSEESDKRGVNEKAIAAVNAVAGDFDNDMDLDLFIVGSGDVGKQENLLLLNRGDGHFDVVERAGGAAGPLTGVGDSVTTADFDGDGFLDLLVASGGSMGRSLGLPSDGGSYQLYQNLRNGNHWLEIDLEGTRSNRDGIGASVRVTAGGVTQFRFQDGGIHHRGQNHSRLHFGLGKHAQVEKISIQWPSGTTLELSSVAGNQRMRITESDK